jgi:hypothetical protein
MYGVYEWYPGTVRTKKFILIPGLAELSMSKHRDVSRLMGHSGWYIYLGIPLIQVRPVVNTSQIMKVSF